MSEKEHEAMLYQMIIGFIFATVFFTMLALLGLL